jgi:hypothetical protein
VFSQGVWLEGWIEEVWVVSVGKGCFSSSKSQTKKKNNRKNQKRHEQIDAQNNEQEAQKNERSK